MPRQQFTEERQGECSMVMSEPSALSFWQGRLVKDTRLERAKEFLTKNFHTLLDSMKHVGLPAADGQSKQSLKKSKATSTS